MANEFNFPEEIIRHIQSFLNARETAQTSILSKSWYISCPIRPVLVFDENIFSPPTEDVFSHKFSNSCTETLKSYEKIDKFTLQMKIGKEFAPGWGMTEHDFSLRNKLAGELVTSALNLGVTEIELKLNYYANFNLRYDLPAQVFASTSLIRLSVDRYVIYGVICDRVLCTRLKSLALYKVKTTDDIVRDILARCPLIENLDLCRCVGIETLNVSKLINLVEFRIVEGLIASVEFIDLDGMNVTEFRCLCRLQLENVRIGAEFFTRFGCMFPCIEDLTLGYCGDYEEIYISSHSLKRLKLILTLHEWERLKKVQLNVPNMSKFAFEAGWGDVHINRKFKPLPSLSFDNVSRDWESDVNLLWRCGVIETNWFEDLRKFLIQLILSRISLDVTFVGKRVVSGEEIPNFPDVPVVEKLKVCTCCTDDFDTMENTTQCLLLGLSRTCCPNLITECEDCEM